MSSEFVINSSGEITAEACAWVAQLESGHLTASDMAALREWMARSHHHAKEIKQIALLSNQLGVLTEMAEPLAQGACASNSLRRRGWIPRNIIAAPVMAIFALAVSVVLMNLNGTDSAISSMIYKTALGEIRSLELPDGSSVKLNTDSQIEIDYTAKARRIRLVQGEALFDVVHNPDRPFLVFSGDSISKAIGTSFVVRLRGSITELAVVDGVVAFAELQAPFTPTSELGALAQLQNPVLVKKGNIITSALIADDQQERAPLALPVIETREIQRKLSWTEGLFDFSQTPLQEVVDEIGRYNDLKIDFANDEIRQQKFGGMFRTEDTASLLEALEGVGLTVTHVSEGHIILSKSVQ